MSNFVGKESFSAVIFIIPYLMILVAHGFMFGTGGRALIAKTMGEGDTKQSDALFSMIVLFLSPVKFCWQFWAF